MKFRQSFVSNSSSSSFIITGKDNISKAIDLINNCKEGYFDYYLINSILVVFMKVMISMILLVI